MKDWGGNVYSPRYVRVMDIILGQFSIWTVFLGSTSQGRLEYLQCRMDRKVEKKKKFL